MAGGKPVLKQTGAVWRSYRPWLLTLVWHGIQFFALDPFDFTVEVREAFRVLPLPANSKSTLGLGHEGKSFFTN